VDKEPIQAKRQLAYVPDDPPLFPDLTVEQHLAFTAGAFGVADAKEKALELLAAFRLEDKLRTVARNLSRGMRQKLAVCCAYLYDPKAILFDEPMTGLDPHGIRVLKTSIAERAANGAAVVISSHLLAMVENLCTHVLIIEQGQAHFCGTLTALRAQFASEANDESLEDMFFQATNLVHAAAAATQGLAASASAVEVHAS
jgi:ABC-2 type transport system ATP-binding protein